MPIYEYRCQACGHRMEKLQKMYEEDLLVCPVCGQSAMNRLISAAAFRLKGSGWYETDFKRDNKRNLAESPDKSTADSKAPAEDSKKTETPPVADGGKKPDAKPAAKPAVKESKNA